jgi:PAS domain S-box-containing protein
MIYRAPQEVKYTDKLNSHRIVNYLGEDPSRAEETRILLQAAIESANDAIIITELLMDEPGPRIEYVNPAFTRMTQYTESEAIGRSPRMLQGPKTSRALLERLRRDLKESSNFHGETVNYRKDGSEYVVEWRITPVRDAQGNSIKWLAVQRDVSERVYAEESLRDLNHDLEQFVYSASHDLQEPIRNVAIHAQMIERAYRDQLPDGVLSHFSYMKDGAKRVGELVSDLLKYTRIVSADEGDGEPQAADGNDVLRKVLNDLDNLLTEKDVLIEHDGLPKVSMLPMHLYAVFQNLISNAIKYSDSRRRPHIRIEAKVEPVGRTVFSISDNGIGIESKYHQQIFGVFKRLHDREYPGTGIGLAIAQKIIEKYNQQIWLESKPGTGSTFYFTAELIPGGR